MTKVEIGSPTALYPYAEVWLRRGIIPHANYRMVYEIRDEAVTILALAHTARLWPPVEED